MLKSDDMQHMSEELNIVLLKHEFLNIHKQFKAKLLAELKCFHDVLDFLQKICPCTNHEAICPNF